MEKFKKGVNVTSCKNTYDKERLEKLEKEIQRQFLKNKNNK